MISDLPSLQPRLGFTSSEPIARKLKAGPLVAVKTTEARPLVLVVVDSRAWHREVDLLLGLLTSTATYVIRLKHFKSSLGVPRGSRLTAPNPGPRNRIPQRLSEQAASCGLRFRSLHFPDAFVATRGRLAIGLLGTQRAQYPLVKEYTLTYRVLRIMV